MLKKKKEERKKLQADKDEKEDLQQLSDFFKKTTSQMIQQINDKVAQTKQISEQLLTLKQFYNDIAYCLTNYHLSYFKKLMKQVTKELEKTILQNRDTNQYTFKSKFKFKTLHKNLNQSKHKMEEEQDDEEEEKKSKKQFQFEIDHLSDLENQTLELTSTQVKDHYKLCNLKKCKIFIKASLKTLYLYNIDDCEIVSGIVETSIFGEKIYNSTIKCIAQQIRIHKTKNTKFINYVTSNMIIEDSHDIKVAQLKVDEGNQNIKEIFEKSILKEKKNNWDDVKDFNWIKKTPSPNYEILHQITLNMYYQQ